MASPDTPQPCPTVYTGTFVDTPALGAVNIRHNHALGVDSNGIIVFDIQLPYAEETLRKLSKAEVGHSLLGLQVNLDIFDALMRSECTDGWHLELRGSEESQPRMKRWYFPGFVDTHIHASQYPNIGVFGSSTLLDWLHRYTFPLESSLSDLTKARRVYEAVVSQCLNHGTTTASYYATQDALSTNLLADICLRRGQRAFIGRCCMDHPEFNPAYYKDESAQAAISNTKATIDHIRTIDPTQALISPIITPRFAPSCTPELLAELGQLAKTQNLPIQTHISENKAEIELVRSQFPNEKSYAAVYDRFNLLTTRTVLAHGVHLLPEEIDLIKLRGSKISHCPISNTALASGLSPVRTLLDAGLDVGLGSDVSGGWTCSILAAAREAGMVSRILSTLPTHVSGYSTSAKSTLSPEECLFLATVGGAKCLHLSGKIGLFGPGMAWDAQLIEVDNASSGCESSETITTKINGPMQVWGTECWNDIIAKWVFCGDDRNTTRVYVNGRLLLDKTA